MATLIAVIAVLVSLGGVWFAVDSARRVRRFARSTDLVPGRTGRAPAAWTTSVEPAAVLHRRVRYAIAIVHENPTLTSTTEVREALRRIDDEVFALDDRLIVAADAEDPVRSDSLRRIGFAVGRLERLAGDLAYADPLTARTVIDEVIAFIRDPVETEASDENRD